MRRVLAVSLLSVTFLFTRFFRIKKSLYFFNDMGRDYQVLYDWVTKHKIPFTGPQSSALPINQSPVYFYYLRPFYLLLNGSVYSSLIASSVLYIVSFLIALRLAKSSSILSKTVLVTFFLAIFHPQVILQNRFIWNPSLLLPLLFLSLLLFFLHIKNNQKKYLFFSILLINLAISLNYSVLPLLIMYLFVFLLRKPENRFSFIKYVLVTFVFLNLPAIIQTAKRFLTTGVIVSQNQIFQTGSSVNQKIIDSINYILGINTILVGGFLLVCILSLAVFQSCSSKSTLIKISARIFLGTYLLTLLSPFNIQAHYVFAVLASLLVFISLLEPKFQLPIIAIFLVFYLQPKQLVSYFKDAPRTYAQMDSCFRNFCSQFKKPLFVSVQSSLYPYHYGPEHRYLMEKNGCQVRAIEEGGSNAENMAVVLDSGSFSDKTRYYELDLFGKFKVDSRFDCQSNFGIVLLSKI